MKIISENSLRIETLSGGIIAIDAGTETEVADEIGLLAMQLGAKQVGVQKAVTQEAQVTAEIDLKMALLQMMEEGNPTNFKADGSPKAAAVNKMMGRTVATDERTVAWESVLNT
jgi:hypothetical protein